MPEPPQDRTEPLRTLTLIALSSVTETPSSDPGTPTRSNPLRSSVTPLAAISTPVLGVHAGDVGCEAIRTWLGDLEEAVGIAGRVRGIDRCARLDLIERLHRRRGRAGRSERTLRVKVRRKHEGERHDGMNCLGHVVFCGSAVREAAGS
jgi:hypothetical protein